MKKTIAAAAVLATLALTGCSAGNQSAEPTPSPTAASSAPATATATPSESAKLKPSPSATKSAAADAGQAWADDMINLFLNGNSKSSFDKFNKSLPHHYITKWGQESKGILAITVGEGKWTAADLNKLGNTVMFTAGNETPELKEVHVTASNGETGKATRENLQDF